MRSAIPRSDSRADILPSSDPRLQPSLATARIDQAARASAMVPVADLEESVIGHLDAGGRGQLVQHPLAGRHVSRVGPRRELRHPERAVLLAEAGLWSSPAK